MNHEVFTVITDRTQIKIPQKEDTPSQQETDLLLRLFSEQRYHEAETLAREMTACYPLHAFGWKVLGVLLKIMGRHTDALILMQKASALAPDDIGAYINLGITLKELGRLKEAEASYREALQLNPDYSECHNDLANLLQEMGRLDEARIHCQRAIHIQPEDARAHNNLGVIFKELDRLEDAVVCVRRALELKPDYADAYNNLGNIFQQLGRQGEAQASYQRAIKIRPDYAVAHLNLGVTLKELGFLEMAAQCTQRALQLNPDCIQAHGNLGVVLCDLGELNRSVASFLRALEIDPDCAETHCNLGNTYKELGRLQDAQASYCRALQIKPNYAEAHCSLGHTLLMSGRFQQGWREYEYRWNGGQPKPTRPQTKLPQWTGQAPKVGEGILIFGEQGMGDKLQFSRYLLLLKDSFTGQVTIVVNRSLLRLFRHSFQCIEVLDSAPIDHSAWQWQCPLLSLPLAFNTSLDSIPSQIPYLNPEPLRYAHWKHRIAERQFPVNSRKIGIVWKPGSLMKNSSKRALNLQQLTPLLDQPGNTWFNLQKEQDDDKLRWVASGILIDWSDEFSDFDDTAALLMNLDLIISVDTAVLHLAGALGKPVWLLNRYASEWRWMRDREDSPWYPKMRIFTQKAAGDWDEVVTRVGIALAA